jgi:hypothetical protein
MNFNLARGKTIGERAVPMPSRGVGSAARPAPVHRPRTAVGCKARSAAGPPSNPRRMVSCKYFNSGYCRLGDQCPYAHREGDEVDPAHFAVTRLNNHAADPWEESAPPRASSSATHGYIDVDAMSYEQLLELGDRIGKVKVGVPKSSLTKLPTVTVRAPPPSGAPPCAICLDAIAVGNVIRSLPCRHSFHAACIDEWLDGSKNCPMCKADVAIAASSVGALLSQLRR